VIDDGEISCLSMTMAAAGADNSVIGNIQEENHPIVYDTDNQQVWFPNKYLRTKLKYVRTSTEMQQPNEDDGEEFIYFIINLKRLEVEIERVKVKIHTTHVLPGSRTKNEILLRHSTKSTKQSHASVLQPPQIPFIFTRALALDSNRRWTAYK